MKAKKGAGAATAAARAPGVPDMAALGKARSRLDCLAALRQYGEAVWPRALDFLEERLRGRLSPEELDALELGLAALVDEETLAAALRIERSSEGERLARVVIRRRFEALTALPADVREVLGAPAEAA